MKTHNRLFYALLCGLTFLMILLVILFNYFTSPQGSAFLISHSDLSANAGNNVRNNVPTSAASNDATKNASGKDPNAYYDLNTATYEQLCTIEGIGSARANSILQKREELGGYTSVDQLLDIEGIGESVYEEISPHLYVS